jgi:aspartate/methionine/tyrosine aminotransferase
MMHSHRPLAQRTSQTPPSATIQIADVVSELRRTGNRILDFSAGRAAEASPGYINQAACNAMLSGDTHQTPAQGKPDYLQSIARKLRRENGVVVDPGQNLIATLGCKNGLTLALMATINPGDEVIVEDPCFVSYGATIGFMGGEAVPVPLRAENGFRWTRGELEGAITDRTRCILICSPQNPTGTVHTEEDLDMIASVACRHNLWVISDEIYERLTWHGRRHICMATRPGMMDRSIGLMGFTKTFSMGGWRIGFLYAPQPVVESCVVFQQHLLTCAGSFAQTGATSALSQDYPPEVLDMWRDWERRCEYVTSEINRIPGLSCQMPEGAFYAWIDIRQTGETSVEFCECMLQEQHVALVPGVSFGAHGEGYVRMTCVKSWPDLEAGLARISREYSV